MKKVLLALAFVFSFIAAQSQTQPSGLPSPRSDSGFAQYNWVRALNGGIIFPARDTLFTPTYIGTVIFWRNAGVDSSLWIYRQTTGRRWAKVVTLNSGVATGTVTSIATNNGTGITGGTITTSGTLVLDTLLISTRAWRQKGIDSTVGLIALKVNISDTSAMLIPYLRKSDTSFMLAPYVRQTRLINTNAPLVGGGSLANDLTLIADTGRANAQLVAGGSLNKVRDSLVGLISAGGLGTVLSVATTDGVGMISSVANPTSTPNISMRVDTLAVSTKLNVQKVKDSLIGMIALKLNISDTAAMLANRLKISDTLTMLFNYLRKSDTATMLAPFVQYSDTANQMSGYLRKNFALLLQDTATAFSVRPLNNRFLDSIYSIRALANTKGTGTVTSVGLSLPSIFSVSGSPITTSGTLTASLSNQNANLVFTGPTSGSPATPTFRSLVEADIPNVYVKYTDTTTLLSQVVRTFGAQSVDGMKTYNNLAAFNAGLQSLGTTGNAIYSEATTGRALRGVATVGKGAYISNNSDTASTVTIENLGTYRIAEFNNSVAIQSYVENNGLVKYSVNKGSLYDDRTLTEKRYVDSAISAASTGGTVTSVATTNGIGIISSVANATTTPNITIRVDTVSISTRAWRQKGIDSVMGQVALKLNISDTAAMLSNYLRKTDTASMLSKMTLDRVLSNGNTSGRSATIGDLNAANGIFSGNLQVNTTGRTEKLAVLGAASTPTAFIYTSGLSAGTSQGLSIIAGTNSSDFALSITDQSSNMLLRLRGDGNFGLGTNTPQGIFEATRSSNGDVGSYFVNSNAGTSAFSTLYVSNDGTGAGALAFGAVGTGNTTGGIFPQDGAVLFAGTNLSGGLNIGTRSNSPVRLYTNATLAATFGTDQSLTLTNILKATKIIGNSGTDNGVDAIQSGGGSVLANLYRAEAKTQATSTTIDATATVWFDNSNGSTVTYTLPNSASLAGGTYRFIKTGTGDLTLSGSIITTAGASVGSVTLNSGNGMKSYYYNGTNWYQLN